MTNFVIFVVLSLSLLHRLDFANANEDDEIEAIFQNLANPKLVSTQRPSIPTPNPEMTTPAPEVLPEPRPIIDENNTIDSSLLINNNSNSNISPTTLILPSLHNNSSGPTNSNSQQQDISSTSPSHEVSFLLRSQDLSKDMEEVRILLWTLFGLTVFIMALMICYLICRMPEIVSSLEVYYHQRMESRAESQRADRERKRALKQQQELERQLEQEMRDRKKELEREMSEKLASLKRDKRRMVASVPVAAPESIEIPQILAAPSPSQILATPPPSIDEPAFLPVRERHSRPTFFIGHNNQPMHLEISCELAKRRQARLKDDKE